MNRNSCQLVPCALLTLLIGFLVAPHQAAACSVAPPAPTLVGQPANGDRQVPTNVVLYYEVPARTANPPGDYMLRTESGEQVALGVSLAATPPYVELKPASELRPNTRYRLDAQWHMLNGAMSETWLTFETGAGPLEQRPDAPRAVLHTYQLGRISGSSCGPMSTATCVSVADDESYIEVSLIDALGQAQPPVLKRGSFMLLPLSAGGAGSRCVELRVRAADGTRSELLRLCGEEGYDADLSMLVTDPQVLCAAKGLQWCDTSGHSGIAPGVDVPATAQPDLDCGSNLSAQNMQAQEALGAAGGPSSANHQVPAAEGGCSALPGRMQNIPALTTFTMLGYILLRRRRR
jgi:hypothetical protein